MTSDIMKKEFTPQQLCYFIKTAHGVKITPEGWKVAFNSVCSRGAYLDCHKCKRKFRCLMER